jgi:hypothetical protein
LTSKKHDSEPLFNDKDIERAVGSTRPIRTTEEPSEASDARMAQLLVEAGAHLREGLLFRRRRALRKYFACMRKCKLLLSQQQEGPTVEEYIAKLARTPSPIELDQQRK